MGRRATFRAECRLQLNRSLVQAACWAHARPKFFDAVKLNAQDETAIRLVARMHGLFGIDAEARAGGLSPEARHGLRLEKAPSLLRHLKVGSKQPGPRARWPRRTKFTRSNL
jgi:hypothetical protein